MKQFQPRPNARGAVTALALAGIVLLAGVPWHVVAQEAAPPPSPAPAAPPANDRDVPSARGLAEMRLSAVRKIYEAAMERRRRGGDVSNEYLYLWSRRWLDAERAVSRTAAERRDAAAGHLKRMQPLDDLAKARVKVGDLSVAELPETEFYRVEAELWLAEERAAGASPAGVPTRPAPNSGASPR